MDSTQVVEMSVTNNSPSQDSNHPDDLFQSRNINIVIIIIIITERLAALSVFLLKGFFPVDFNFLCVFYL